MALDCHMRPFKKSNMINELPVGDNTNLTCSREVAVC